MFKVMRLRICNWKLLRATGLPSSFQIVFNKILTAVTTFKRFRPAGGSKRTVVIVIILVITLFIFVSS